ncbi:MAG: cation-translocating P-type ATPase [Planctomycetota bacterium]
MNDPQRNAKPSQSLWHAQSGEQVLESLGTAADGLNGSEVVRRRNVHGPNRLPEPQATPEWRVFLRQFANPLIYVLVAAAVVSLFIGDVEDAIFIGLVLLINAGIGAYQEAQAEKSSLALRKLLRMHAQVQRDGDVYEIMADELVPGDIVWLESGNRVGADLRLLSTQGAEIDESLLTGESMAVSKNATWIGGEKMPLSEHRNMAFAGSMVTRGRAKGVVVATGLSTQVGQLAVDVMAVGGGAPPLLTRMERFTTHIAIGTLVIATMIGAIGMFLWRYSLQDTFFLIIALAVSAIPEGLPVAMTVALAIATSRMARRNVIVRRLTAVEGLGSCTLIATDKTGTLTCNELTVREMRLPDGRKLSVTGEGFAPVGNVLDDGQPIADGDDVLMECVRAGILCNESDLHQRDHGWVWRGDAVDIAILSLGHKLGLHRETLLDRFPQIHQIPFESEHQFAATFHRDGEKVFVVVKGAPERVLAMCANAPDAIDRSRMELMALHMAEQGLRVIAIAKGEHAPAIPTDGLPPHPGNLRWLGFLGMIDPLRPDARAAVAACHAAGVQVAMITGDHRLTALAIARDLGLAESEDQVMTSSEIEGKSSQELAALVQRVRVFARVTPRQKLQLVNAAREAGHFVAVTGDGVNDAPALRAANIGVAMGKSGTDVAREAAELVISDDNFGSIVSGIEEGRIAYDNIRKVTYLLVSMGAAELLMVLLAVLSGLPVPLLPVQLLWLNLVTDGIQGVALAFEPGEGDALQRNPRDPHEPIFNRLMIERILVAVMVVGVGGFAVFALAQAWGWSVEASRNLLLLTMVLFENFHIGNCRSETKSAFYFSPLRSPVLFFGTLGAFLLHVVAMYVPILQSVLKTEPVDLWMWGLVASIAILVVPAVEWHKWLVYRRAVRRGNR